MTSPDDLIRDLDAALADVGEDVKLRRPTGVAGTYDEVDCRARLTGYDPQEVTGDISQQDQKFVLSPTEINAAQWPGFRSSVPTDVDNRVPRRNDVLITSRGRLTVQAAAGFYVQNILVRIEGRARGN